MGNGGRAWQGETCTVGGHACMHPLQILRDTVNERAVRILLECILVLLCAHMRTVRVTTRPGKPGKMRVHLENLEISWNFETFNKYHGKMP